MTETTPPHPEDKATGRTPRSVLANWISMSAVVLALVSLAFSYRSLRTTKEQIGAEVSGTLSDHDASRSSSSKVDGSTEAAAAVAIDAQQPVRLNSPRVRLLVTALELSVEQMQQEAEQVVNQLEKRLPDRADSLHVAALFYAQTRQTEAALQRWARCIVLSPKDEIYYVNLAAIAMDRGENELALSTLQKARDLGFSSDGVMHHWGLALSAAGRLDEAIAVVEKLANENPADASAWYLLGKMQLETGAVDSAIRSLETSLGSSAANAGAYLALGQAYNRRGEKDKAAEFLTLYREKQADKEGSTLARFDAISTSEMRGTIVSVLIEAANLLMLSDDSFEGERLLLRALAIEPRSLAAAQKLANLYFRKKMLPEEAILREKILELAPHTFGNYVDLAKVYAQLQDMPTAEAIIKLAITMRPQAVEGYATLAELHLQLKNLAEARWYAEQAILRQQRVEGYQLLAAICEAQDDTAAKQKALQQAEQLRRKNN